MEQLPLFVFGTLRRGQCNHYLLAGKFNRSLPARLHGFVRVHPMMIVSGRQGRVEGELYFLHADTYRRTMADCDFLEDIPPATLTGPHYRRMRVRVSTDEGEFVAWAYVHPATPDDWPDRAATVT